MLRRYAELVDNAVELCSPLADEVLVRDNSIDDALQGRQRWGDRHYLRLDHAPGVAVAAEMLFMHTHGDLGEMGP